MKNITILIVLALVSLSAANAGDKVAYSMPRSEVVPIAESATGRQYELYVKLPEDYAKNAEKRYPVIYTTDAVWHMDLLSGVTEYLMPEVILVGISWQKDIDRTLAFEDEGEWVHASRYRDYTTVKLDDPTRQAIYHTGSAADHLAFIRNDVIPLVEGRYRAAPGDRAYLGYSLGGAFGAYILLAEPDTFKNYIIGAPALGERSFAFLDALEAEKADQQASVEVNVFLAIGDQEREQRLTTVRDLAAVFARRAGSGVRLTGPEVIKDSDHGTAVPETFTRSIKWLSRQVAR